MKYFNVNEVNTRQISRKWLMGILSEEEQQMFKAFVKSLESQIVKLNIKLLMVLALIC